MSVGNDNYAQGQPSPPQSLDELPEALDLQTGYRIRASYHSYGLNSGLCSYCEYCMGNPNNYPRGDLDEAGNCQECCIALACTDNV